MTISTGVFASNSTIIGTFPVREAFRGELTALASGCVPWSGGGWSVVFGPVVQPRLDLENFKLLSRLEVKGNGHGRTLAWNCDMANLLRDESPLYSLPTETLLLPQELHFRWTVEVSSYVEPVLGSHGMQPPIVVSAASREWH